VPVDDDELDLRVRPLGRAEITTLPGTMNRAHEADVGRRHARSMSGALSEMGSERVSVASPPMEKPVSRLRLAPPGRRDYTPYGSRMGP
jgi:hypothetical protein